MKLVKTSAIALALCAMLAGPVLAQGASSDTQIRGGAQGRSNMQGGASGSMDDDVSAQPGAAGEKAGVHAKSKTKGTVGAGSGAHVCLLYFQQKTGTSFALVPYRGGAPVMQDLVAGQIDMFCAEASQTLTFLRSGTIKVYAVMSKARWPSAPDVPTMDEVGVSGMYISFWNGLWVPKGTPKDVVAKLDAAVVETLADPAVRQRLTELGHVIATREEQTPEGLAAFHKAEIDKWWPIIKAANIKLE